MCLLHLQKIGLNEFSLLGWSDGGISSLILAAKYPNNVKKLVIWGASAYVTPEEIQIYESILPPYLIFFLLILFYCKHFSFHCNKINQVTAVGNVS